MTHALKLNGVAVNLEDQTAAVGGGALWKQVDAATTVHGMAVPAGLVSHTGVGGLTLGGGVGWLCRCYGLTSDSLLEATVVTAGGSILTASQSCNQDLFWGLRGAGAGLGVVTQFTFKLRPCTHVNMLEAHFIVNNHDAGVAGKQLDLLAAYAKLCSKAPTNVSIYCFVTATSVQFLAAEIIPGSAPATTEASAKVSAAAAAAATTPPEKTGTATAAELFSAIQGLGPIKCRRYSQSLAKLNRSFDQGNRHGKHYRWYATL